MAQGLGVSRVKAENLDTDYIKVDPQGSSMVTVKEAMQYQAFRRGMHAGPSDITLRGVHGGGFLAGVCYPFGQGAAKATIQLLLLLRARAHLEYLCQTLGDFEEEWL